MIIYEKCSQNRAMRSEYQSVSDVVNISNNVNTGISIYDRYYDLVRCIIILTSGKDDIVSIPYMTVRRFYLTSLLL